MEDHSCRLLIRKFPDWLKAEDKESLLRYFGAIDVTVMADKGKMRNCAFAQFRNLEETKMAMMKLHQLDLFGYKLVVVYATAKEIKHGSVHDNWGCDVLKKEAVTKTMHKSTQSSVARVISTQSLPGLNYMYPPPDQLIISNISNAISCVPKLYVQVLHLMNKMNLPPPFGPPTLTPLLPPGPEISSEESEIESDDARRATSKPFRLKRMNKGRKRQFDTFKAANEQIPPAKTYRIDEAFPDYSTYKKLEINAPTELNTESYTPPDVLQVYQIPEASQISISSNSNDTLQEDTNRSQNLNGEEIEQFVSKTELESNKMSREEMQAINVYKNYEPGEQSRRLYVKNLSKQATEKDLKYIYGRYIDWQLDSHVNSFDIRVMQQGRMKGQAFIGMPSEVLALQAVQETNGFILHGKPMVVQFARSTKAKETDKIMIDSISKNS